jgi:hypothetical protein
MRLRRDSYSRFVTLVRITCALALLLVAFAHRPIGFAVVPFDVSAYTLPDGTIPDLCVPGNAGKGEVHPTGCEFCRLAVAVILPEPSPEFWRVLAAGERIAPLASALAIPPLAAFLHPVRGPPAFS